MIRCYAYSSPQSHRARTSENEPQGKAAPKKSGTVLLLPIAPTIN